VPGTSRSKNPRSEPLHQKSLEPLDAPLLTLVILSGVYDTPGSDVTHVTRVHPLVAALLSSEPRPERHVSGMSQTQNPCSTRAFQNGLKITA
jgi:hypothetical protein